ncbi:hypothetical protein AOLI_G00046140 [Acnodon oligacanthus]
MTILIKVGSQSQLSNELHRAACTATWYHPGNVLSSRTAKRGSLWQTESDVYDLTELEEPAFLQFGSSTKVPGKAVTYEKSFTNMTLECVLEWQDYNISHFPKCRGVGLHIEQVARDYHCESCEACFAMGKGQIADARRGEFSNELKDFVEEHRRYQAPCSTSQRLHGQKMFKSITSKVDKGSSQDHSATMATSEQTSELRLPISGLRVVRN